MGRERRLTGEGRELRRADASALKQRERELECLYRLCEVLDTSSGPLAEILQSVVDLLPSALVHPSRAFARINLGGEAYQSRTVGEAPFRQDAEIIIDNEAVGSVEVGYLTAVPGQDPSELLWKGRGLLESVALKVSRVIERRAAEQRLLAYQDNLRSLASELTLTEQRERRDIAHDLHDRIGQSLAFSTLKLDGLLKDGALSVEQERILGEVCSLLRQSINDTRTLVFELSPPSLYERGLVPAVEWLADRYHAQFDIDIIVRSNVRRIPLTEDIRVMLYRAVRELLTNTVKHSRATSGVVIFETDAERLSIRVEDDGCGFVIAPAASSGFGLFGIQERLRQLGAQVAITSSPGQGTRALLQAPLAASHDPEG